MKSDFLTKPQASPFGNFLHFSPSFLLFFTNLIISPFPGLTRKSKVQGTSAVSFQDRAERHFRLFLQPDVTPEGLPVTCLQD